MSAWQRWLHHPESLWVRKAFFQIHLWVGVGAGLYIIAMSISGSMIVYREQLDRTFLVSIVERVVDFHGSHYMVAWNQQLASQLDCELEVAFWALQLGPTQCTGILVPFVCFDMGSLWILFCFSAAR